MLLGDGERALAHLRRPYAEHGDPSFMIFATSPVFRPLLPDPRYREMLETIGATGVLRAAPRTPP
jgi:hypothetical protein